MMALLETKTRPARTPVKVLRPQSGRNRARAQLYLVAAGPARPFKDTRARDIRPVTTRIGDEQEVTAWALLLLLGLAIVMAGYIFLAKVSGSFYLPPGWAQSQNPVSEIQRTKTAACCRVERGASAQTLRADNAGPGRDLTPPFGRGYKKILAQIVQTSDTGRLMS